MNQLSKASISRIIGASIRVASATTILGTVCIASSSAAERDAQVVKALSYAPRQSSIAFDKVTDKEIDSCTGKYETRNGFEGLVIYSSSGQPLRRFADSNGDRQVDQWCYYKDGIEVYRDIDSDFNGAADQYRWLGTAGTRWGIDSNEDGKIDEWKSISAEEVTMEVVEAIKARDDERFRKLLVTDAELKELGLGEDKGDQLTSRLASAKKDFAEFARTQKLVGANTKWAHFAADKPGVVPAGTEGSSRDIIAYENAIAIVENDSLSQQLMIGTLVQIDGAWRLADLPKAITEGVTLADSGLFFPAAASNRIGGSASAEGGLTQDVQNMLADLERLETAFKDSANDRSKLQEDKATLLQKLVIANKDTGELELWVKQFADSTSSAAQTGEYVEGVEKMREMIKTLSNIPKGKDLIAYVAYRLISTDYTVKSSGNDVDFAKLQVEYMEQLEEFAGSYPNSVDAADAMIQIGLNHELSGKEKDAETWYRKVSTQFPKTVQGDKASGALARLTLEGRQIGLVGKTLDGKSIDSKSMAKMPILVHYWASWCEPCKADMAEIRKVQAKYARQNLQIIGVNLDTDANIAKEFLNSNKSFPWPHIHEQGGFESSLAIRLGVLSVPITFLIDGDGRVVKRTSHFSKEMQDALEELLTAADAPLAPKQPVAAQIDKRAPALQGKQQPALPPDARKAQNPNPANGKGQPRK
jgi:thiol-disulfide isomerase/thioredoxin